VRQPQNKGEPDILGAVALLQSGNSDRKNSQRAVRLPRCGAPARLARYGLWHNAANVFGAHHRDAEMKARPGCGFPRG